MLNLDKELEQLSQLGEIAKSALSKVKFQLSEMEGENVELMQKIAEETEEALKSGKGLEELKQKLENYEGNR